MGWFDRHLSIRETTYALAVVALLTLAIGSAEVILAHNAEKQSLASTMNQLFESVADTSARAAYHVDERQAEAVLDGLMKFKSLESAQISTDLGVVLAKRTRKVDVEFLDGLANWLFGGIAKQQRVLIFDRLLSDTAIAENDTNIDPDRLVGIIELKASSEIVGRRFLGIVSELIIALLLELFLVAAALAYIFHRSLTKPLLQLADDLGKIDPQGTVMTRASLPTGHEHDELGLVVTRTNELLQEIFALHKSIAAQQVALMHRERVAALGSMLAGVAHELNNPLAVVMAQTELLAETADNQETRDRAAKILKPVERCARIVRTFLALARQRDTRKTYIKIEDLISDVRELLEYQFRTNDIEVLVNIAPDFPEIWGDGAQISQVLMNLLINSQQALMEKEQDRSITIEVVKESENRIAIVVSDNGTGIPASIQDRVFEPFFTTKPEGQGTGLGLSYCQSVAEGHDGIIEIEKPGHAGTSFRFEIPVGGGQVESNKENQLESDNSGAPLRILVVDDETSLLDSIVEQMTRLGHAAEGHSDARQAIDTVMTDAYDIILTDIRMPELDGPAFYAEVITQKPQLSDRFIFITGDSLNHRASEFIKSTNSLCIEKPFRISDLNEAIAEVVRRAKNRVTEIPADKEKVSSL